MARRKTYSGDYTNYKRTLDNSGRPLLYGGSAVSKPTDAYGPGSGYRDPQLPASIPGPTTNAWLQAQQAWLRSPAAKQQKRQLKSVMNGGWTSDQIKFIKAAAAGASNNRTTRGSNIPSSPRSPGGPGGGSSGGGSGVAGTPAGSLNAFIEKWYRDALAKVNADFDAQWQQLDLANANAAAGVRQVGGESLRALQALGRDSATQNAASRKTVQGTQNRLTADAGALQAQLARDLARQGVDARALGNEAAYGRQLLAEQGGRQKTLSDRFAQIDAQTARQQQGTARMSQQAALGDLARVLEQSRQQAGQKKADARYQIEQQYQQQLMQEMVRQQQMALAAASARRGGGGGRGGYGSNGDLTDSEQRQRLEEVMKLQMDPFAMNASALANAGFNGGDPHQADVSNWYLSQANAGTSYGDLLAHYNKYDANDPGINFKNQIQRFLDDFHTQRQQYNNQREANRRKAAAWAALGL